MEKLEISALVLAKNEEVTLKGCLLQLSFAKEIIVLDQNSTDDTFAIAERLADKVLKTDDENFSNNRNLLAKNAKFGWLLYIDPDERLSAANVSEVKSALGDPSCSAYYFPRKNVILGKWLKHGGWWPDYVPRLIKRDSLKGWEGDVHESPKVDGVFGQFKHPITHLSGRSMEQMFAKTIKWGQIEASLYMKADFPRVTIIKILKAMLREFSWRYFKKRGLLDGKVGLIEAIYQSLHQAIVLVYLWEMQNRLPRSDRPRY